MALKLLLINLLIFASLASAMPASARCKAWALCPYRVVSGLPDTRESVLNDATFDPLTQRFDQVAEGSGANGVGQIVTCLWSQVETKPQLDAKTTAAGCTVLNPSQVKPLLDDEVPVTRFNGTTVELQDGQSGRPLKTVPAKPHPRIPDSLIREPQPQ